MIKFDRGIRRDSARREEMREEGAHSIIGGGNAGWVAFLLLFGVSVLLSSRILEEHRGSPGNRGTALTGEAILLSRISRNPSFAFGFRNFLGDIVWLRAVQTTGSLRMTRNDYDELYMFLNIVINLDPRFKVPYLLGGILLGDSQDHAREALNILERGRKNHPDDWRFPFYIGYTQYFSLGDPLEGAKALEAASRIPGSPTYLPLLAARMYSEGRAPDTALTFLEGMVRQESDPARLEVLHRRIREVIVERDIQALEKGVSTYREKTGTLPEHLSDLVRSGLIREIPEEPNGGAYLLFPDGSVRSDRVTTRLKVFRKR